MDDILHTLGSTQSTVIMGDVTTPEHGDVGEVAGLALLGRDHSRHPRLVTNTSTLQL